MSFYVILCIKYLVPITKGNEMFAVAQKVIKNSSVRWN